MDIFFDLTSISDGIEPLVAKSMQMAKELFKNQLQVLFYLCLRTYQVITLVPKELQWQSQ
jgi:hypothetical protein